MRLVDHWQLAPRWLSVEALAAVGAIQVVALILSPNVETEHLIAALSLGVSVFGIFGRVIRQNLIPFPDQTKEETPMTEAVPHLQWTTNMAVVAASQKIGFYRTMPWGELPPHRRRQSQRHHVRHRDQLDRSQSNVAVADQARPEQSRRRNAGRNVYSPAPRLSPAHVDVRKSGNPREINDMFVGCPSPSAT